jgi:cell division inhibitor SepF
MRKSYNANMEVCVFKPTNVDDGRDISDTLSSGKAVILNLEGLDIAVAQRIIDFTSGAVYSMNGKLENISNYIFIVTPESVDISGDFQEMFNNDFKFPTGNGF